MLKKLLFVFVIIGGILSCSDRGKSCDSENLMLLDLAPVNTTLKVPRFLVIDSVSESDSTIIFERKVRTLDSTLVIIAGVTTFENNPEAIPDVDSRMRIQRQRLEAGKDSIEVISEAFRNIGSDKGGHLKYLDKKRGRYDGRIFFNRGSMFVDIWLFERYNGSEDHHSAIDCVIDNMEIK